MVACIFLMGRDLEILELNFCADDIYVIKVNHMHSLLRRDKRFLNSEYRYQKDDSLYIDDKSYVE